MENIEKINIAELLEGCPQGMELDCTNYNGIVTFEKIIDCAYYPIEIGIDYGGEHFQHTLTKYGESGNTPYNKCIIFPKGKTTWEGFQRPFRDGDITYTKTKTGHEYISIFKEYNNNDIQTYIDYSLTTNNYYHRIKNILTFKNDILYSRLCTEKEKTILFQVIKNNGCKWNQETKTLEKLFEQKFKVGDIVQDKDGYKVKITEVNIDDELYGYESVIAKGIGGISFNEQDDWELVPNKFDIANLKPFDKVLCRDSSEDIWTAGFYSHYETQELSSYHVVNGTGSDQCIPYEGNEHLIGKTDDCDDFYKTWK